MKLVRIVKLPGMAVEFRYHGRDFQNGKVYPKVDLAGISGTELCRQEVYINDDRARRREKNVYAVVESAGETPDMDPPATLQEVPAFCEEWLVFALSHRASELGNPADIFKPVLAGLHKTCRERTDWPALPSELRTLPKILYPGGMVYSPHWQTDVADIFKQYRDWAKEHLSEQQAPAVPMLPVADSLADYRDGPGGPLLTAKRCKERYFLSNSTLSKKPEEKPGVRIENPHGRGYIYRYDFVSLLANQRDRDD